jgi:hypothetical protein
MNTVYNAVERHLIWYEEGLLMLCVLNAGGSNLRNRTDYLTEIFLSVFLKILRDLGPGLPAFLQTLSS